MVEVTCHFTLNKYRYSEQINFVNLWLDKQAIGFIFPIHYKKRGIPKWNTSFFIVNYYACGNMNVLSKAFCKIDAA